MRNKHLAVGVQNVDPFSIVRIREIHMPNYVSRKQYLLNLDDPLVDILHDRLEKVGVSAHDLAEIRKISIVDIVTSGVGVPGPFSVSVLGVLCAALNFGIDGIRPPSWAQLRIKHRVNDYPKEILNRIKLPISFLPEILAARVNFWQRKGHGSEIRYR
jgi:hypothetical protein